MHENVKKKMKSNKTKQNMTLYQINVAQKNVGFNL